MIQRSFFRLGPWVREEVVTPPRRAQEAIDCDIVNMVKTLNGVIAAVSQDTARIQRAYQQLCKRTRQETRPWQT